MKRENSQLARSEDKKARLDAGLDLDLVPDLTDSQLGHVVKEVTAPRSIQEHIDSWVSDLISLLNTCKLKIKPNGEVLKLLNVESISKFPGVAIDKVCPVGALASKTLVFPNAGAALNVTVKLSRQPASADVCLQWLSYCVALFHSILSTSSLVDSLQIQSGLFSSWPHLQIRPKGKLVKHLTVDLVLCPSNSDLIFLTSIKSGQELSVLHGEIQNLLDDHPTYKTVSQTLTIWSRQCKLLLPDHLLDIILLHCHITAIVSPNIKPWQSVKKLWSFLAGTPLLKHQLIIGVASPVPRSGTDNSPILAKDGIAPLYPNLGPDQWNLLVVLAGKSSTQNLEISLLRSIRTEALYDRVYSISGPISDPCLIISNMRQGLGDRCKVIALVGGNRELGQELTIDIGTVFDPVLYWQPATQGPVADSDDSAAFREFWGSRSELRRFQDGVVKEVVVWGERKDEVVGDIVRAVVARHHKGCQVTESGDWGIKLLSGDGGLSDRQTLDSLVPVIYGLDSLPLSVAGVTSFGPAARCSRVEDNWLLKIGGKTVKEENGRAVLTGKGGMVPHSVTPFDVMLVAEHSGKWPKDEQALKRVRLAWLMEVGKGLVKKEPGILARRSGDNLLVMKDKSVLRLSVGERVDSTGQLCELSSWLSGLSKTISAWSGCVRLCLRWVSAMLLSSLSDIAVEVTCAAVLSSSSNPPSSSTAAFVLWLHTVANHDWNDCYMSVPGCETSKPRSSLPPMAVLTPHSPTPSHWTKSVTWPELQRLVNLASLALDNLHSPRQMFTPSLDTYEIIIKLRPLRVSNRHLSISNIFDHPSTEVPETSSSISNLPLVDFNPMSLFVSELQQCYGHLANFYFDRFGGTQIAVKIRPDVNKGKVGELSSKMPTDGAGIVTNWSAVIEDWKILGEGIVQDVEISNSDALL